jgi:hypothetical protein
MVKIVIKQKTFQFAIAGIYENCSNLTQQDAPLKKKEKIKLSDLTLTNYDTRHFRLIF